MKNILLLVFLITYSSLKAQNIITIAGGGTGFSGFCCEGGMATDANIGLFGGLAVDIEGNIFIATAFQRILKVELSTGRIFTFAGTGVAGYNGDNILATNAQTNNAGMVFTDSLGNVYIGDGDNYRIRKVDKTSGIITTVAGNGILGHSVDNIPATAAKCDFSTLAFDNNNNMILQSDFGHKIRKIDEFGIIMTIAGTGIAGISGDGGLATNATMSPRGNSIATDKYGNIYFADSCFLIRKINRTTNIISKFAGTCIGYPYAGDFGPATNVHFGPAAIAIDDTGSIYVCDGANSRIEIIDTFGIIHSFIGIGIAGYCGDNGPASLAKINLPENVVLDKCGNIYIADFNNKRVRKVVIDSNCFSRSNAIKETGVLVSSTFSPNPAHTLLTIETPTEENELTICNPTGQVLLQRRYKGKRTEQNIENLPQGIYFIKINNEKPGRFIKE